MKIKRLNVFLCSTLLDITLLCGCNQSNYHLFNEDDSYGHIVSDSGTISYEKMDACIKVIELEDHKIINGVSTSTGTSTHLAYVNKYDDIHHGKSYIEYIDLETGNILKCTSYDIYKLDENGELIIDKTGRYIYNQELIKSHVQPLEDLNEITSEREFSLYLPDENLKNEYNVSEILSFYRSEIKNSINPVYYEYVK